MTLEHESQVTRSPSEPAGRAPRTTECATAGPADPVSDSRRAAAQRKAAAAKEAAAKIRASARQYRIEPAPAPPSSRRAPVAPARRELAEPPASPRPAPVAAAPPAPAAKPVAAPPAPAAEPVTAPPPRAAEPVAAARKIEVTAPPPPRLRPRFPTKTAAPAISEAKAAQSSAAEPAAGKKPAPFRPMRRPDAEPPAFKTAYVFRSAMGARSAGRLLIGEAQPIRPSRPRGSPEARAGEQPPRSDAAPAPQARAAEAAVVRPAPAGQPSRFDRLSQDLAERQTWLGVDPETLKNGGPPVEVTPPSRWGRLTSWLFGGNRNTTG